MMVYVIQYFISYRIDHSFIHSLTFLMNSVGTVLNRDELMWSFFQLIGVVEAFVAIYCLLNIEEAKKRIKFENALFLDPESDAGGWLSLGEDKGMALALGQTLFPLSHTICSREQTKKCFNGSEKGRWV